MMLDCSEWVAARVRTVPRLAKESNEVRVHDEAETVLITIDCHFQVEIVHSILNEMIHHQDLPTQVHQTRTEDSEILTLTKGIL